MFLIHKINHLNIGSKMEQIFFACDHSTQQLFVRLHIIYLKRKGVVGGVILIAEQILSKIFSDIYWLTQIEHPLKISIGFLLK